MRQQVISIKYIGLLVPIIFAVTSRHFISAHFPVNKEDEQIPALCYHNLREKPDKENLLFISKNHFDQQMKFLFDNGYHTISPDQLYRHFTLGDILPSKPIIISFDDSHEEHFSIAKPILEKYGFKGVFFVMTVCINKRNFLTSAQIKELADKGHTIGAHTWDHPDLAMLKDENWKLEIDNPKYQLEKITGRPVESFAYPYGAWNNEVVAGLKQHGIKIAFQLTGKPSAREPLMTIRRMMVSGSWSIPEFQNKIASTFERKNIEAIYFTSICRHATTLF